MRGEEIFKSVCQAYKYGHEPEVCRPDFDLTTSLGQVDDFTPPDGGNTWWILTITIFLTILFNIFLIRWCMRKKRKEQADKIQTQVQLQVENYFKLESVKF